MEKEKLYNTFFFKEYAGIIEKNTYSAYIPYREKGMWLLLEDSGIFENLSKKGAETAVIKYMENSEFSIENMKIIISEAGKNIIKNRKIVENKYTESFSILILMAEKDEIIIGNIGTTKLKIFRENKIFQEFTGNRIKNIKLKKNDYILIGNLEFWETVNEIEIPDVLMDLNSKGEIEKQLSEEIEKKEKLKNRVIPFLSVFFIEEEKDSAIENQDFEEKKIYGNSNNPLKFFLFLIIPLFIFIGIGKSVQIKGYIKKAEEHVFASEMNIEKKNFKRAIVELEEAISYYRKTKLKDKKTEMKIVDLEKKKKLAEIKENNFMKLIENIKPDIPPMEISATPKIEKNVENKMEYEMSEPLKQKEKRTSKKIKKRTKKKKVKKQKYISELDKEIARNWEILGRDKSGNKKI